MSEPTAKIRGNTRPKLSAPVPAIAPDGGQNDDLKQNPGHGGTSAAGYGCAAELRDRATTKAENAKVMPARRATHALETHESADSRTYSKNAQPESRTERIRYERTPMPNTSDVSADARPQRSASRKEGSEDVRNGQTRNSRQSGGKWQRRRRWKPAKCRKRRTRLEYAAMIRPVKHSHDPWLPSQAGDIARGRNLSVDEVQSPSHVIPAKAGNHEGRVQCSPYRKGNISEGRKAEARTKTSSPAGEGRF